MAREGWGGCRTTEGFLPKFTDFLQDPCAVTLSPCVSLFHVSDAQERKFEWPSLRKVPVTGLISSDQGGSDMQQSCGHWERSQRKGDGCELSSNLKMH